MTVSIRAENGKASVEIDGKEVSQSIVGYAVKQDSNEMAEVILVYACHKADVSGEMKVIHACPLKEEGK